MYFEFNAGHPDIGSSSIPTNQSSPKQVKDSDSTISAITPHPSPVHSNVSPDLNKSIEEGIGKVMNEMKNDEDKKATTICKDDEKQKGTEPSPSNEKHANGLDDNGCGKSVFPSQENNNINKMPISMPGNINEEEASDQEDKCSLMVDVERSEEPSQSTNNSKLETVMGANSSIVDQSTEKKSVQVENVGEVGDDKLSSQTVNEHLLPTSTSQGTPEFPSNGSPTTINNDILRGVITLPMVHNYNQPPEQSQLDEEDKQGEDSMVGGQVGGNGDAIPQTAKPTLVLEGGQPLNHLVISYVGANLPILPFEVPEGVTITYVERDSLPEVQVANEEVLGSGKEGEEGVNTIAPKKSGGVDVYESDTSSLVTDAQE